MRSGTRTDRNFTNGCRYFLKKRWLFIKLPARNKLYYLLPIFFLLLSFCYILVMSLQYLSGDGLIFLCFFVCGALAFLLWITSKKRKGSVSLPIVWWELPEVLLIYLYHNVWVHGYKVRPEDLLKMVLSVSMKHL